MKRNSRTPSRLSESVHQRLSSYALAAGAAGVGILALAQTAEAKIIYTPKHLKLTGGKTFIDINNDGTNDFYFRESITQGWGALSVVGVKNNSIVGGASALPAGVRVGPKSKFGHGGQMVSVHISTSCTTGGVGRWANVQNRYLGLKFYIKGTVHYGWARLTVISGGAGHCGSPNIEATLSGYAYETVANKAITTGKTKGPDVIVEPATLGHLATGAAALSSWRIQRTALDTH
jgi:hypothetical protein